MRTHTVQILSVTFLVIVATTVIAEGTFDKVKEDKANEIDDDDETVLSDSDIAEACDRTGTSPNLCPCQSTNTSIICCNLGSPTGLCDSYDCSATEITLLNCHLHSTVISKQFILSIGICQSSLRTIRLRNCSISDTTFGQGLEGLRVLDLRGNQVKAFREPEIASLESIYLSGDYYSIGYSSLQVFVLYLGNNWPCIDPTKEKQFRSKSNLKFGEQMSWLLEDYWRQKWMDHKLTFCNLDGDLQNIEDESLQKHSVDSFLQFTKVTANIIILIIYLSKITENLFLMSRDVRL